MASSIFKNGGEATSAVSSARADPKGLESLSTMPYLSDPASLRQSFLFAIPLGPLIQAERVARLRTTPSRRTPPSSRRAWVSALWDREVGFKVQNSVPSCWR
jgi:hypothetical protein